MRFAAETTDPGDGIVRPYDGIGSRRGHDGIIGGAVLIAGAFREFVLPGKPRSTRSVYAQPAQTHSRISLWKRSCRLARSGRSAGPAAFGTRATVCRRKSALGSTGRERTDQNS